MTQEPSASAHHVYWIADNGSSHKGVWADIRLADTFPAASIVHTTVHASWLNQVEVYFSIVSRKALHGQSFDSLDALADRIIAFEDWYNRNSHPFNWTWTRQQLHHFLDRLATPPPTNL